jgi:hypothetical protein
MHCSAETRPVDILTLLPSAWEAGALHIAAFVAPTNGCKELVNQHLHVLCLVILAFAEQCCSCLCGCVPFNGNTVTHAQAKTTPQRPPPPDGCKELVNQHLHVPCLVNARLPNSFTPQCIGTGTVNPNMPTPHDCDAVCAPLLAGQAGAASARSAAGDKPQNYIATRHLHPPDCCKELVNQHLRAPSLINPRLSNASPTSPEVLRLHVWLCKRTSSDTL